MHKHLATAFAVSTVATCLLMVGGMVAHIFVGYAALAAIIYPSLYGYGAAAVVGVAMAATAPRDDCFKCWAQAGMWCMWFTLVVGMYTHPSNELRAAMEARGDR